MKKANSFLKVAAVCVASLVIAFLLYSATSAAEYTNADLSGDELLLRLDSIENNQKIILQRLDSLEETLIKEIKIRCTK